MKILIIPKVLKRYKNQIEFSIEEKLIFLKNCFKSCILEIAYNFKFKRNYDLCILSGGNTIIKFSKNKKDKIRNKLDNYYFKKFHKKIPIIGICHGAQFLAEKEKSVLVKSKNHTKPHDIIIDKQIYKKQKLSKLKSHHNYKILNIKNYHCSAFANDNSVESFYNRKNKVVGIIWHPDRQIDIKQQTQIILKYSDIINSSVRKRI